MLMPKTKGSAEPTLSPRTEVSPLAASVRPPAQEETSTRMPKPRMVRLIWQLKAVRSVAFVLLNRLLLFMLATVSWRDTQRHTVLFVAGAGAVAICAALLFVLTYLIQRPMVELQEKIARVGDGDLTAHV